jgi:hypothetical protein
MTREGVAGLQRDNNLAGKIQREWTLEWYKGKQAQSWFLGESLRVRFELATWFSQNL